MGSTPRRVVKPRLTAAAQLEKIEDAEGLVRWKVMGDDPQFALEIAHPLYPGRYRIAFDRLEPPPSLHCLSLYVDSGAGYNEGERLDIRPALRTNGQGYEVDIDLAWGARALRLDPPRDATVFAASGIALEQLVEFGPAPRRFLNYVRKMLARQGGTRQIVKAALRSIRQDGLRGLLHGVARGMARAEGRLPPQRSYENWVYRFDTFTATDIEKMRAEAAALAGRPKIAVLMPVYNTPEPLLREAIESVLQQVYHEWELCIADDASTQPHVRAVLEEYRQRDPRIKVAYRPQNGHISRASNAALELVEAEWTALLDHDDVLRPHALLEVAKEIEAHPDAGLIYSDEDKLSAEGRRYDGFFKPDFSMEMFRSHNYLNHLTVHRTSLVRAVGGWRAGYEGSQDYDLNLRIVERLEPARIRHIPKILYHWRAVEGSTAASGSHKNYAYDAGLRALQDHVARTGLAASAEQAGPLPFYRLRHALGEPKPKVSLIIPTRDRVDLLKNCVDSILRKTTYQNYEIIVMDNDSAEPDTLAYLAQLARNPRIRVVRWPGKFNYSSINNVGAAMAQGEILGLVNNDIEVISPGWLDEMVSWAVQPEIGCVGAKLYYGDGTIQHGGVVVGLGGVACHSHKAFPGNSPGYFGLLHSLRNVSAVTGACLLLRKSLYEEIGGLDEANLAVAFNDVDLCLRVRDAGYRNVWTPYAELYHLESVSRGQDDNPEKAARFRREIDYMKDRWAQALRLDPFYSPNLTEESEDYGLAFPPRI